MDLWTEMKQTRVPGGEVALFWLGQAGFFLKDAAGHTFAIDPYLTDCGYRMKQCDPAFKRLTPMLLDAAEFEADFYLATHHHFDHFDYDAIPLVAKRETVMFCGPSSCQPLFAQAGVPAARRFALDEGMALTHAGITVTATHADHGELAPDAIGAVVEMGGVRVWFSGDTCYRPERLAEIAALAPDVAVVCINGAFGNMNAAEGAAAACAVGAKTAIPCHFWTLPRHGGAPWDFAPQVAALAADCKPVLLRQGEGIFIPKATG